MNATENRFSASFDDEPILDGREYIKADVGSGVTVRAYVEFDQFTTPDENYGDAAIREAWNRDEWRFCELALHVYLDGVCIEENAANLCGIATGDGDYLTERANDLIGEIDVRQIVEGFAKKATAAARAMKKAK
jgi:hypothetical protein